MVEHKVRPGQLWRKLETPREGRRVRTRVRFVEVQFVTDEKISPYAKVYDSDTGRVSWLRVPRMEKEWVQVKVAAKTP